VQKRKHKSWYMFDTKINVTAQIKLQRKNQTNTNQIEDILMIRDK